MNDRDTGVTSWGSLGICFSAARGGCAERASFLESLLHSDTIGVSGSPTGGCCWPPSALGGLAVETAPSGGLSLQGLQDMQELG